MVSGKLVGAKIAGIGIICFILMGAFTAVDFRFGIKNKTFIDVTDANFGADPTGVADSTAGINAAILASANSSGTPSKDVFFPAGTYLVSSSLNVTRANVHLRGVKMGASTIQWTGSSTGKLINDNGGARLTIDDLTLNANGGGYGLYCADQSCYQNKLHDVEVVGATGTPGVGVYCLSNCYSQEWRGMRITNNNIGAQFPATSQGTGIVQSKVYGNNSINLIIGDGNGQVSGFFLTDDDIEVGGLSGSTIYDIQANQVIPLIIHGGYFESGANATSADIMFVGTSYNIVNISGVYSNANITGNHAILIGTAQVHMMMSSSYYFNSSSSTFDSETANGSTIQFVDVARAAIGCTPSIPGCTSPLQYDFSTPTAVIPTKIQTDWLDTAAQHSGNIITMNSGGSKDGFISIGTDAATGSWCDGFGSSDTQALGTCIINWDAAGRFWVTPDSIFPAAPLARTTPGLVWDNIAQLTLSGNVANAASGFFLFLGDLAGATNTKWWAQQIVHSTGDLRITSNNDDGSANQTPIDMGRNGGLGLASATACTNFNNCAQVTVQGGLALNTSGGAPTCATGTRGEFFVVQGGSGVKDTVEVCAKDASNVYAWRSIY